MATLSDIGRKGYQRVTAGKLVWGSSFCSSSNAPTRRAMNSSSGKFQRPRCGACCLLRLPGNGRCDEGGYDAPATLSSMSEHVAHGMNLALLPSSVENLHDGGFETFMRIWTTTFKLRNLGVSAHAEIPYISARPLMCRPRTRSAVRPQSRSSHATNLHPHASQRVGALSPFHWS